MGGFAVAHQKYFPLLVRNQDDEVNIPSIFSLFISGNCGCLCQLKLGCTNFY